MLNLNDFYRQLSLLVNSKLPLNEAFKQLNLGLKSVVTGKIQNKLERGEQLSQALEEYPGVFPKEHVSLIKVAEQNDTLSETLSELAKYTYFEKVISDKIKDLLLYPMIVFIVSACLIGFIGRIMIYPLTTQFYEMNESLMGYYHPSLLVKVSHFVGQITYHHYIAYWSVFGLIVGLFFLFYFNVSKSSKFQNFWIKVSSLWTDLGATLQSTKICGFLALQFKNKSNLHESCDASGSFVSAKLKEELKNCTEDLKNGVDLINVFNSCEHLDPLIINTIKSCPEDKLAGEMGDLAGHFYERVFLTTERLVTYWKVILTLVTALITLFIAQIMMAPIIELLGYM